MESRRTREAFAAWLALPKLVREPRTQKELADALGVNPATLTRWKRDVEIHDMVFNIVRSNQLTHLPDLMNTVMEKGIAGDYRFAKLGLELTTQYTDKITIMGQEPHLGIEQYSEVVSKIAEWRKERFGE